MLYSTALFAVVCASSGTKEGEKIPARCEEDSYQNDDNSCATCDSATRGSKRAGRKPLINLSADTTERTSELAGLVAECVVPVMQKRAEWLQNFLVNRPFAPESFCRTYKSTGLTAAENAAATENVCPDEYCVFDFKATESKPGKKDCTRKYFCEDDDRQEDGNKDQNGLTADQKFYCDKVNRIKDSEAITELPPVFKTYVNTERAEGEYNLAITSGHNRALEGNFWDVNVKNIVDTHDDMMRNHEIKRLEKRDEERKKTMATVSNVREEGKVQKIAENHDTEKENKKKALELKNKTMDTVSNVREEGKVQKIAENHDTEKENKKKALELTRKTMDTVSNVTKKGKVDMMKNIFGQTTTTLKESSEISVKTQSESVESEMSMDEVQKVLSNFPDGGITIVTLKDAEKLISRYNRDELEFDEQKKALEYVKNRVEKIKVKANMYVDNIKKNVWTDELKHFCRSLFLEETKEQLHWGFQFERDGKGKITGIKGRLCQDPKNDKNQKRCESHYTQEACETAIQWQKNQYDERRAKENKTDRGTKVCKFESSVCVTSKESNIKGLNGVGLMMGDSQETFDAVMKKLDDEARADANKHQYKTIEAYGRCTDASNTRQVNNIEECKAAARDLKLEFKAYGEGEDPSQLGPGCRVEEGKSIIVRYYGWHESVQGNKTPIRRANNLICAMRKEIVAKGEPCDLKNYCHDQKKGQKDCEDAPEFLSRGYRRDGENGLIFICDSNGDHIIVDTREKPSLLKQSTVTEHIHF